MSQATTLREISRKLTKLAKQIEKDYQRSGVGAVDVVPSPRQWKQGVQLFQIAGQLSKALYGRPKGKKR